MKRLSIILAMAAAVFASCRKEESAFSKKGVELTISACMTMPAGTKTTYTYTGGTQAGTISTDWDVTEYITVVSIGDAGITAIDEFKSTGTAGRDIAEFTGLWTGNAGDRIICLYPALTNEGSPAEGTSRYTGVAVGATSITVSYAAHAPFLSINGIKDYDLMIGDVSISGSSASVALERKISVLQLVITGGYAWDGDYGENILSLGIAAHTSGSVAKLFATSGTISTTKATYSGDIITSEYQSVNRNSATHNNGTKTYYLPVLVNGTLESGDVLSMYYGGKVRYSRLDPWENYSDGVKNRTLTGTLTFSPGYVYSLAASL